MAAELRTANAVLPSPVQLKVDDEIIWSSKTGRTASGYMVGDVVAEKKSLQIDWGILTEAEVSLIRSELSAGFHALTFRDDGAEITIEQYRGTLSKQHLGYIGDGVYYYRSASVTIVQR